MIGQRSRAFLIAAALCSVFYWFVTRPFMEHSILKAYTTEHATEYAIVGLFFWANCDLLLCALRNRRELQSSRYRWLPTREGIEPVSNAETIYFYVLAAPKSMQSSMMFRRLMSAVNYIKERNSAIGFREYLKDLAERDSEEIYSRYSFPRFATGILPILGLLGTVVHFGGALSGLSTDDLASKVPQIVSGMGTAFNTTCAALSASTTTMLFRYLIETQEEGIGTSINQYVEDQLLHRFVAEEAGADNGDRLDQAIDKLANLLQEAVRMKRPAA